ncbi:MAG: alpha/beta fold hydrolase, partial [Acidimicrobiales bacterium]
MSDPTLPPDVSVDDAEILGTSSGRPFVRTPDECFDGIPDFPWEPRYVEVDGLRMHYVEAGDPDGEVVLCLHGQPDWSYLYRKMIPVLGDAGMRVIAPDHIGFGRSDKPVQLADYTFLQHVAWNEEFVDALEDTDVYEPLYFRNPLTLFGFDFALHLAPHDVRYADPG